MCYVPSKRSHQTPPILQVDPYPSTGPPPHPPAAPLWQTDPNALTALIASYALLQHQQSHTQHQLNNNQPGLPLIQVTQAPLSQFLHQTYQPQPPSASLADVGSLADPVFAPEDDDFADLVDVSPDSPAVQTHLPHWPTPQPGQSYAFFPQMPQVPSSNPSTTTATPSLLSTPSMAHMAHSPSASPMSTPASTVSSPDPSRVRVGPGPGMSPALGFAASGTPMLAPTSGVSATSSTGHAPSTFGPGAAAAAAAALLAAVGSANGNVNGKGNAVSGLGVGAGAGGVDSGNVDGAGQPRRHSVPVPRVHALATSVVAEEGRRKSESMAAGRHGQEREDWSGESDSEDDEAAPRPAPVPSNSSYRTASAASPPTTTTRSDLPASIAALLPSPGHGLKNDPLRTADPAVLSQLLIPSRRRRTKRDGEESDVPEEILMKRQKNTEAARRSRLRKSLKLDTLERRVRELEERNGTLQDQMRTLETERDGFRHSTRDLQKRCEELEWELENTHKAMAQYGLEVTPPRPMETEPEMAAAADGAGERM